MERDWTDWMLLAFWGWLTATTCGDLSPALGLWPTALLLLLFLAAAQMAYGALYRHGGRVLAALTLRLGPLLLLPALLLLERPVTLILCLLFEACQIVALLGWSDDDIGGWGRRRWAALRRVGRTFARPVMGDLPGRSP